MKRLLTLLVIAPLLTAGCGEAQDTDTVDPTTEMTPVHNALTEAEVADGWSLLFDGDSIDWWRGFRQDTLPASWQVADGAIYYNGEGGGDIVTVEEYGDFEFAFEWKISEGGNSGVIYRADEDHDTAWMTGPEYQILDNFGHPDRNNGDDRLAGANYDMHAVDSEVANAAGEWNTARIVANGPHVEHWLNGEKVVEYEMWSDDWEAAVANSKWADYPDYGSVEVGHIALQDHGDPVWYRNLKIRRIVADTDAE